MHAFHPATRAWFEASFAAPTPVQRQGWPAIGRGEHTLLLAPTGSGKTLAAFLAVLDRLVAIPQDASDGVRVLYVSPLKALVYDIERNLRAPLRGIREHAARLGLPLRDIRVDIRTGDSTAGERRQQARRPADILVTTPESLYLLQTSAARATLASVQAVIVDEIHVMAGTKRGVHLALGLERLAALAGDPQRIGLSATQQPVATAALWLGGERAVTTIDAAAPPGLDLRIVVPLADMERPDPPPTEVTAQAATAAGDLAAPGGRAPGFGDSAVQAEGGIWPSVYPRLLALIRSHRCTLIFTNSRLLCERLARRLNELAGTQLVQAHHGSIAHERRAEMEAALKAGQLPAIVATSSLELGIDMGAIDLVVLVESPGSAARGLQRVGRSGHDVGAVSVGRLFPKYRGDLLEAAVVGQRMVQGRIEATRMPTLCLDVLAQQIVAIVAMEPQSVADLHALVRRAGPYRELSLDLLTAVLDMLCGRYPAEAFSALSPRLNWDRGTDRLTARRGARLLSVLGGGTIPDRGLFRVHLGEGGPRLGELDEELVHELRVGDTVVLGASSWRVDAITRERVLVSPAPGQPGRLPFWHGERPGRPLEIGRAMGALLAELAPMTPAQMTERMSAGGLLDDFAVANLVRYVDEQRQAVGALPTDAAVTVERFRDELGDWRVCILTPLGARVHAPWAMALEVALGEQLGRSVQTIWSDDGIALRLTDGAQMPETDALFVDPEAVEGLLLERLLDSALFATRFRDNAARALLLPRRRAGGRTPLWLQRKRSADLLAVARRYPAFPVVLETVRECMQEVFDLPALVGLLEGVQQRRVRVDAVQTPSASPMARSLLFQFIATFLYDGDAPLAERRAMALSLDRTLLRQLLGGAPLHDLLDAESLDEVQAALQCLSGRGRARHADGLHDLLRRLGELDEAEVAARCDGEGRVWLAELAAQRRAVQVWLAGRPRWIAAEDAARYRDGLDVALPPGLPAAFLAPAIGARDELIVRWARTHGPFAAAEPAERWGLPVAELQARCLQLEATGGLVGGALRPGASGQQWCDPEVLRRLRRRTMWRLQREVEPVEDAVLGRFLPRWQGLDAPPRGLEGLTTAVARLEGLPMPVSALESEILPARVADFSSALVDQLGALGGLVWIGCGALGPRDGKVALYRRDRVRLLVDPPPTELPGGGPLHAALLRHLGQRGASFLFELQSAAPEASAEAHMAALWDLVWAGLTTNDTFGPLRSLAGGVRRGRVAQAGGRWSLVGSLLAQPAGATERALARAEALLDRYGVVGREIAQAEGVPGGFAALYPVLREMAEAGRVQRGHFVAGLSGAQFALPGAVERLRACREEGREVRVLAATDPALAWGAVLPWPASDETARRQLRRVAKARVVVVDGAPVLYLSASGRRLMGLPGAHGAPAAPADAPREVDPAVLRRAVDGLRDHLGHRMLRITRVDGQIASEAPLTPALLAAGAEADLRGLLINRLARGAGIPTAGLRARSS